VKPKPELVLVGVTVLWASTFVVTKDFLRELPPLQFSLARFGIGSAVMLALYWRKFPASRRAMRDGIVLGLLNSSGLLLQLFGQAYTTASKSAFVTSLNTPLTPLIGLLLYGTRPSKTQQVAVVIATVGVMLLTWPNAGARWNLGDLLTVGCAVLYGLTIVQIARRTPGQDAVLLTVIQVVTAAALFAVCLGIARALLAWLPPASVPELLRLEQRPFVLGTRGAVELGYMALVCTVVTFTGQTWAMARMSATHAAVIFSLEPVFATVMALCVATDASAEWPGARGATGAALVTLGVMVSEIRLVRRRAT
jgi:drug/metabolite transporter (DMT)-like permease